MKTGGRLSRDEMDLGKKLDEDFYELFAGEYNNKSNQTYGKLAHELPWGAHRPDPGNFHEITPEKAKDALKNLFGVYDKAYGRWKRSGNHGDLSGPLTVRYLHQFIQQRPDVLSKVVSDLGSDTFYESIGGDDRTLRGGRGGGSGGGRGGHGGRGGRGSS